MRSTKLCTAVLAGSAALALAPGAASALPRIHPARAHRSPAGCHITVFAEPHLITSGEKVEVFGSLVCPAGETTSGQTVTIYTHTVGAPGFTIAGTTTTGTGGAYAFPATAVTAETTYYTTADSARSVLKAVRVAPQVTVTGAPEGTPLITGYRHPTTFIGTVSPTDSGAEVVLEREQATAVEEWGVIQQHDYVQPNGTYSIVHHFAVPGDANLRVVVRVHGSRYAERGISNTLSYEISQAENPRLTISSSANPLPFGSPTTLSGTYAPAGVNSGASQKLVLFARTAVNPVFAQVAETTAGPTGDYQFVIPAEGNNTAYQIRSVSRTLASTVRSAVLFEGVKYILTAAVSAPTVQAGQALTWSGTVTPGVSGKNIYLERENPVGGGFHVVDVAPELAGATPGSPGTYSLSYVLHGSGNQLYRVRVPGDPTDQATASPVVSIAVTPAPLGSLRPQPQSTLPH